MNISTYKLQQTSILALILAMFSLAIIMMSSLSVFAASSTLKNNPCPEGTSAAGQNNGLCATCQDTGQKDDKGKPIESCAYCKAGSDCSDKGVVECSKKNCDLIAKYVNPMIKVLSGIVGLVAVISLIIGGIQYSASEGDPQKAAKAKSRITYTIMALIFYMFLFAFLQFLVPGGVFQ